MTVEGEKPIKVLSDHKNLEYFMTTKELNRRQARWAEFLSQFNFKITYRPGKQGTKPDSLTRRSQDMPSDQSDQRLQYQHQVILKAHNLEPGMTKNVTLAMVQNDKTDSEPKKRSSRPKQKNSRYLEQLSREADKKRCKTNLQPFVSPLLPARALNIQEKMNYNTVNDPKTKRNKRHDKSDEHEDNEKKDNDWDLQQALSQAYVNDEDLLNIMNHKTVGERRLPSSLVVKGYKISMSDMEVKNNQLYVYGKLYVPQNKELRDNLLKMHHEAAGHAGTKGTYELLSRSYFWMTMSTDAKEFVHGCYDCKRKKPFTQQKQGLLRPLEPPFSKWRHLAMDFAEDLPSCKRYGRAYRHVLVVVDRNSKGRRFAPLTSLRVEEFVDAFRRVTLWHMMVTQKQSFMIEESNGCQISGIG